MSSPGLTGRPSIQMVCPSDRILAVVFQRRQGRDRPNLDYLFRSIAPSKGVPTSSFFFAVNRLFYVIETFEIHKPIYTVRFCKALSDFRFVFSYTP
jgi:hypothetical protein